MLLQEGLPLLWPAPPQSIKGACQSVVRLSQSVVEAWQSVVEMTLPPRPPWAGPAQVPQKVAEPLSLVQLETQFLMHPPRRQLSPDLRCQVLRPAFHPPLWPLLLVLVPYGLSDRPLLRASTAQRPLPQMPADPPLQRPHSWKHRRPLPWMHGTGTHRSHRKHPRGTQTPSAQLSHRPSGLHWTCDLD